MSKYIIYRVIYIILARSHEPMLQGMEQFILSALQALIYRERILNICYAMFVVMKEPSLCSRSSPLSPLLWLKNETTLKKVSSAHDRLYPCHESRLLTSMFCTQNGLYLALDDTLLTVSVT